MSIRFDDKGKFFTEVIEKEAIQVIIQTSMNIVRGKIHIIPGHRVKDEINKFEDFFAVTEATIYNPAGREIYRSNFLALNRTMIHWVLPENELIQPERAGDD